MEEERRHEGDTEAHEEPRGDAPKVEEAARPEGPHDVEGKCSRCGGKWPCLRCLTSTPPFIRVHNNF